LSRLPSSKRKRALVERLGVLAAGIERLPWDDAVSEAFGEIKAVLERRGERVDDFDLAIAAHAIAARATLVTGNTKHFARVPGLEIEDWG
jgi:tRNA(fMet)-specific endonuclease VapC